MTSPLVIVQKGNGSVRICVDFSRTLNRYLKRDHYPMPRMDDIFAKLTGCTIFCVLDCKGAYLQLEVQENCRHLLTVTTHMGLFQFNRLCFGLSSAPQIWQSTIDQMLRDIDETSAYLDDIIIGAAYKEELDARLMKVLERLNTHLC